MKRSQEVKNKSAKLIFERMASTNNDTLTSYLSLLMTSGLDTWDNRAQGGLGATKARPVSSGTEENVLCTVNDPYQAGGVHEDIFLHEFAHSVDLMALEDLDPDFRAAVQAAYDDALANNLYQNTYAEETAEEYWAEGVQTWFNTNLESDPPNGLHNSIDTRAELESYDPALHGLISRIFPTDYDGGCPAGAP